MEIEHHLFCILFNFKFQNFGRVEGRVCTNHRLKMKEFLGIRGDLVEPDVQSILYKAICHVLLYDAQPRLCNVLVEDVGCVFIMHERSPPHLFLYLFI